MPESRKNTRIVRRVTDITKLTRAFEQALLQADKEKTTGEIVVRVVFNEGGICKHTLQAIRETKAF